MYDESAARHYRDAEYLASNQRYDNAGHLIGFAAECALKHAFSIHTNRNDLPMVHLPTLANAILKRFQSRNASHVPIRNLLESMRNNFFNDWNVSDRYEVDGKTTLAKYTKWKNLATRAIHASGIKI